MLVSLHRPEREGGRGGRGEGGREREGRGREGRGREGRGRGRREGNSTNLKLHSVGVRDIQRLHLFHLLATRYFHRLGLLRARESVTTCQLHPSPDHTPISGLVLARPLVIGDDQVDVVENICGTLLRELVLQQKGETITTGSSKSGPFGISTILRTTWFELGAHVKLSVRTLYTITAQLRHLLCAYTVHVLSPQIWKVRLTFLPHHLLSDLCNQRLTREGSGQR